MDLERILKPKNNILQVGCIGGMEIYIGKKKFTIVSADIACFEEEITNINQS